MVLEKSFIRLGPRKVGLKKVFNWLVLEKGWYKKGCLSALCWRKVGLRKTVYPAWMEGNLFIRPGSKKRWSEESDYLA